VPVPCVPVPCVPVPCVPVPLVPVPFVQVPLGPFPSCRSPSRRSPRAGSLRAGPVRADGANGSPSRVPMAPTGGGSPGPLAPSASSGVALGMPAHPGTSCGVIVEAGSGRRDRGLAAEVRCSHVAAGLVGGPYVAKGSPARPCATEASADEDGDLPAGLPEPGQRVWEGGSCP